jgi:hypothetical protein
MVRLGRSRKEELAKAQGVIGLLTKEREMTIKELVSKIAKLEGKKHQASVGDVREIVGLLCDALIVDAELVMELVKNGKRRSKKTKKV